MSFGRMGAGRFGLLGAGAGGGTVAAGPAPVLSVASAVDFSDTFVWGQATTDTASGTLYAVVVASAASTPSAAQIVAGTDAAGAAAPNGNAAVSATGVRQVLVPSGLTAATSYKVCMAHRANSSNSNVVTGAFTTDTLVISFITNGTATGMTFTGVNGSATPAAIADPHGGTNALRWIDVNDAASGQILTPATVAAFFNGENKFHMTAKTVSGAAFLRLVTSSITTVSGAANFNSSTGALGTVAGGWLTASVAAAVYNVGSGWWMFSARANCAGADLAGVLNINKCVVDNTTTGITRNGTHVMDIYNLRITRV